MPTWGKLWSFSCNDRTCKESCLWALGDTGGDENVFPACNPSKLKGGTISIRPILCGPTSGLYKSGLEGKLPVIKGEENGVGNVAPGIDFPIPEIPCKRDNLIPLLAQNDSSARAWCPTLPESGLCIASTSSVLRLQPKDGLISSKIPGERGKKSVQWEDYHIYKNYIKSEKI